VWGAIAAVMVLLALAPVGPTGADDGGVTVEKSGWWSQANQEVPTPNGPFTPPLPKSPLVPEDSLPVTSFLGQPQNVSAIGFAIPEDMAATTFELILPLAEGGGADSGGSSAKIAACAVTSYWEGTENGKWDAKPEWDCNKAKAPGKRNDDGSWTFDLGSIAALWADPFEDVARADGGIVLVPDDATSTFQVAFAKEDITIEATLSEVTTPGDDAFTVDVSQETIPAGTPTFSEGSVATGDLPAPTAERPSDGSRESGGTRLTASRQHDVGNIGGNLPLGMLLLVPLVLVVAVLAGQSVSARERRPDAVRRQGGVGRALAARATQSVRRTPLEMP
jgi:hypothetical protein